MKIRLELDIYSDAYNEEQLEALRMELRKRTLPFIFKTVDDVPTPNGPPMRHQLIFVNGDIQLMDN